MSDTFTVGAEARIISASPAGQATVTNGGGSTVYYKKTSDVGVSSNDGSLTKGESLTLTAPKWFITAPTGSSKLFVEHTPDEQTDPATQTELDAKFEGNTLKEGSLPSSVVTSRVVPSGDTTGATDMAAINKALEAGGLVVLGGLTGTLTYTTNTPLKIPSNTTLVLWNAELKLAAKSNCNLLQNSGLASGNENISVIGVGRAILNHNGKNQEVQTTGHKNVLALMVKVKGLYFENLTIEAPTGWGISPQIGCETVRIRNIRSKSSEGVNSSPIQIYGACTDFVVDGVWGESQDDCVALLTYTTAEALSGMQAYEETGGLITQGTIRNLSGKWGVTEGVPVRLLSGDAAGNAITRIKIENVHNFGSHGQPIICLGPPSVYVTGMPAVSQMSDITIRNISCISTGGAVPIIAIDQLCQMVTIDGVLCTGEFGNVIATQNPQTSGGTFGTIEVKNVRCPSTAGGADLVKFPSNYTMFLWLHDWDIQKCKSFLKNSCSTGAVCDIRGIHIRQLTERGFQSSVAETGNINGVTVDLPTTNVYSETVAMKMKMGDVMPVFKEKDKAPANTLGSKATCEATLVLDEGEAKAAYYVSGATKWKRLASVE